MDFQRARDWTDFLLKVLTMLAILAGGAWGFYQFWIADTIASNIQLAVSSESQPYSADSRLLLIHIKPKNIGKVRVSPGKSGLRVSIRSIPSGEKAGILDLEKLPEFYNTDLMKRFPDGYELEPGVEYDEVLALVVPKGSMYAVKAVLDLDDNTEVDHTAVARIESN
jgi:hypothetical protein